MKTEIFNSFYKSSELLRIFDLKEYGLPVVISFSNITSW